jgi:hypothetical protein
MPTIKISVAELSGSDVAALMLSGSKICNDDETCPVVETSFGSIIQASLTPEGQEVILHRVWHDGYDTGVDDTLLKHNLSQKVLSLSSQGMQRVPLSEAEQALLLGYCT